MWCFVKAQDIVCCVLSRNDCKLKLQIMHSFDQNKKTFICNIAEVFSSCYL